MLDNVIKFPTERIRSKCSFDIEFQERTKDLTPELASCLKVAYERVVTQHGADLPAFELHLSGVTDVTTEKVKSAVASLMDNNKERVLSMLKHILTLEAEICMLRHHSDAQAIK